MTWNRLFMNTIIRHPIESFGYWTVVLFQPLLARARKLAWSETLH